MLCTRLHMHPLSNCPKRRAVSLAFRYAINFMTMGSRPLPPTNV
jgi:hypothetical protein